MGDRNVRQSISFERISQMKRERKGGKKTVKKRNKNKTKQADVLGYII